MTVVGEYIRGLTVWIAFIAIPVLLFLSLRGWWRCHRMGLVTWRDRFGLASIATASVYWLTLPVWMVADKFTANVRLAQLLGDIWENTALIAMILAAPLSSFLKGSARAQALTASILMVVVFYLSAVE